MRDEITFSEIGSQTFSYSLPSGHSYSITIMEINLDQYYECTLPNDTSGTINEDKIIVIVCALNIRTLILVFLLIFLFFLSRNTHNKYAMIAILKLRRLWGG